jgi:rubredoxin
MKKWRCTVCGYIHVGDEPPETCPVCGADKSKFELIVEEAPAEQKAAKTEAAPPEPDAPAKPDPGALTQSPAGGPYQFVISQMLKHHLHPISTHVPNGVLPVSFVFIILATLFGFISLGTAALCNMAFVVISLPVVLFSGYIEWQNRYQGLMSGLFIAKIAAAATVTVTAVLLVVWWIVDPGVLQTSSLARNVFIFVSFIMLAAAGIAGFIGGKLVFKD